MDGCDDLLCGRIDDLKGPAINRLYELVVDEAIPRVSQVKRLVSFRYTEAGSWWSLLTDQWAGHTRPSEGS